jgi:hypothetical protein
VHLVAAHEIRRSFPVDSISVNGAMPESCEEIVMPGVHSDIGSGYCPTEQGRGVDADGADMLARIPLIYMYRAARLAGVPLKLELASDIVKKRFAVTPGVIDSLNSYLAICRAKPKDGVSPGFTEIMREQTKLRIMYHRARRIKGSQPVDSSESFKRATTFDKNDLHSAYIELDEEIAAFEAWMNKKKNGSQYELQAAGFDNEKENEWKEIARWWKTEPPLPDAAVQFFDDYVHDSRAWFKISLTAADSEPKALKLLEEWATKLREHDVSPYYEEGGGIKPTGITEEQTKAAREYMKTGKIPRMRTEEREAWNIAGYLRYRKVYAGADRFLISKVPALRPGGVRESEQAVA